MAPPIRQRRRGKIPPTLRDPLVLNERHSHSSYYNATQGGAGTRNTPRGDFELTDRYPTTMRMQRQGDILLSNQRSATSIRHASASAQASVHTHIRYGGLPIGQRLDIIPCMVLSHGCACVQCVRTQEIGFSETCGAFESIIPAGLHIMWGWPFHRVAGRLSLRMQQWNIGVETLTLDRVFVTINVCCQFRVSIRRSFDAFYRMRNPHMIIRTCLVDAVQSICPILTLDELYGSKHRVSEFIVDRLNTFLLEFGYELHRVLVNSIIPVAVVKEAIDDVAASRSMKFASAHKAEANKTEVIKKAEAEAERSYLLGYATARERHVIVDHMKQGALLFQEIDVRLAEPPSSEQVMTILLTAQYMDLLTNLKPTNVVLEVDPQTLKRIEHNLYRE